MGCGTCGTPAGFERVWLYKRVGQREQEFRGPGAQAEALRARQQNGDKGVVQRVTRRLNDSSDTRP